VPSRTIVEMFRAQVRRFVENELVPKIESWNRNGRSDRESWRKMGEAGFLGANAPAEYGNSGVITFLVNHDGTVFQKDLGPRTAEIAGQISSYNPDQTWKKVDTLIRPQ